LLTQFLADRVVKAEAFDEAAIAAVARISSNDVVERALLRAATGQTNYNHGNPLNVL
jgi:hypothetical protein